MEKDYEFGLYFGGECKDRIVINKNDTEHAKDLFLKEGRWSGKLPSRYLDTYYVELIEN